MNTNLRWSALAGGIVAACALAFLSPLPQGDAWAQGTLQYGTTGRYYSGYGPAYYGDGLGYGSVYRRGLNGYSGYGVGPYGYRSEETYVNPYNSGYGYGNYGYRNYGGYSYSARPGYYARPYGRVYNPYRNPYLYGTY